jgi:hypothetical protein
MKFFGVLFFTELKFTIMTLKERMGKPTPMFFRRIRNIGIAIAAIGGTLLAAPVALPAVVIKVAGYLTIAGSVASAVSQVTTEQDDVNSNKTVLHDGQ